MRYNKDLAYVIGVLHGDGTICNGTIKQKIREKEYSKYRIKLAVIDRDFAEYFMERLICLGLRPIFTHYSNKKYNGASENIYEVILNNKQFVKYIYSLLWVFPRYRKHSVEILRGFLDSEGSLSRSKNKCSLILSQNHESHLKYILQIISHLEIYYYLFTSKSRINTHGVEYSVRLDVREVHKLLGKFTIGRKEEIYLKFIEEVQEIGLSQKEIAFLKENRVDNSYADLSKKMHKNKFVIRYHCQQLKLRRKNYERNHIQKDRSGYYGKCLSHKKDLCGCGKLKCTRAKHCNVCFRKEGGNTQALIRYKKTGINM